LKRKLGDCAEALKDAGVDMTGLEHATGGITLWTSTRRGEGALLISDIVVSSARGGSWPISAAGNYRDWTRQLIVPIATTLERYVGVDLVRTNEVVLRGGFYAQTAAEQDITLVHEALHVFLHVGSDTDFPHKIRPGGRPLSQPVSDWLKGNWR
jgi:hypothetical protein